MRYTSFFFKKKGEGVDLKFKEGCLRRQVFYGMTSVHCEEQWQSSKWRMQVSGRCRPSLVWLKKKQTGLLHFAFMMLGEW